MDPLRDRIFGLLSDLCGHQHEISPDGLRLLGHTLLGVARDHAPTALFAVRDALPWVAALVELSEGADAEAVAQMLASRGVVRALGPRTVARRLEDARRPRATLGSTETGAEQARLSTAIRELALLDRRLVGLSMRSDRAIRDEVLDDAGLLAAVVELCGETTGDDVARRFREALRLRCDIDPSPLALLADIESSWDGGRLRTLNGFGERSRRFEISACDHLRQSGFAPAVRAALVFGGRESVEEIELRQILRSFGAFSDDRTLEDLCVALCRCRGKALDYVRGRRPLAALDAWIAFLRGPCHELAESREVSIREATSFAHFCLHLLDFCDLATTADAADDEVRRSVMHVEDELKEFALQAQRKGLADEEANLATWEAARWGGLGRRERVAERVARLAGGWRAGFIESDTDGPPRLHDQVLSNWRRALDELDESVVALLDDAILDVEFVGGRALEAVTPDEAIRLLLMTLASGESNRVDLSVASDWFLDPSRRTIARAMLGAIPIEQLVTRDEAAVSCGFAAEASSVGTAIVVRRHPEFEALLVLTSTGPETPEELRRIASRRLQALVQTEAEETADEVQLGASRTVPFAPGSWING